VAGAEAEGKRESEAEAEDEWASEAEGVPLTVSSISSIRKLTARIALEVCLFIPFIFEIWCRHTTMEAFNAGSPAGHRSRCSFEESSSLSCVTNVFYCSWWRDCGSCAFRLVSGSRSSCCYRVSTGSVIFGVACAGGHFLLGVELCGLYNIE